MTDPPEPLLPSSMLMRQAGGYGTVLPNGSTYTVESGAE